MASPWERIDDEFKAWLKRGGTSAEEFNSLSVLDRQNLLPAFQLQLQLQQQQQQQVSNIQPEPPQLLGIRETLESFKLTETWKAIARSLDEVNKAEFTLSSLESCTVNGRKIPLQKNEPSLLLYGLTDTNRYNGAALALLRYLNDKLGDGDGEMVFLQAVSGAGKTRALLDLLANSQSVCGKNNLVYFDLASLVGGHLGAPKKNFYQDDVRALQHDLPCGSRADGKMLFRALLLARTLVIEHLRTTKQWNSENLLLMQLAMPSNKVLKLSRQVLKYFKNRSMTEPDWEAALSKTFVALDEANVALGDQFGSYESSKDRQITRPFLTCISDVLCSVPVVFSGTSYRLQSAIDSLVSNLADVYEPNYFTEMTLMQSRRDISTMMSRFGIDISGVPTAELAPLFGRCRFVSFVVLKILAMSQEPYPLPLGDLMQEAIASLQAEMAQSITPRLYDPLQRLQIEKIVVAAMIDKPMNYDTADENLKSWADQSFFWVTGKKRLLEVAEPLTVVALQHALLVWDPILWIVNRIRNEPALSPSQQGFDFEQISARKLAMALSNGTLRIQDNLRNEVPISQTPDGATAYIIKSSSMTLDEFLADPQCSFFFLPANKDGPDVVFWIRSSEGTWYAVFIQSKYYQNKISGNATLTAARTVISKGSLAAQHRRLQIFFPFMGATCTTNEAVLSSFCNQNNDVYMYLCHENDGAKVLGEFVCKQLLAVKSTRQTAP